MKTIKNIATICICFLSFVCANAVELPLMPQNIHVLLEKDATEALLEVRGAYYIFNPRDGSKISSGVMGKRYIIRPTIEGLKWGQEYPGIHQIVVIPRSDDSKILLNGIQYDGAIAIIKAGDKINLINHVDIESYLKSVLSTQFQYPLEAEAMAALAIAARTTAYYQVASNISSFWHVDGSISQYQGSSLIIPDSISSRSVDATKNLILVNNKDGQKVPFSASWNEHCGGKTAPLFSIFRQEMNAPQVGVEAPIAALDRKDTRWSYSMSSDSFCSLFQIKNISCIDLFQDTSSGKVYAIRVKENEKNRDIDFFTLQSAIGSKYIQSNDFIVFMRDNEIHFVGYGRGHGVGLCLHSASCMAQNGDIAVKILSKFFPNTDIINLSLDSPSVQ